MILVTGASGFVGRHVVRELAASGTRVRAMVRTARGASALEEIDCELVRGDVTDPASLRAASRGMRTIVHLVSIVEGSPATFERVMATGTGNLVEAARETAVRRIVLMSALGTGPGATVPYFRAKWAAEQAVSSSGVEHVVLRPSFVFGTDGGALPRFLRIARLAPVTPVIGPGTQRVQPIWIGDLVRAVALAVEAEETGVPIELGGPEAVTWSELWRRLKAALGTRRPAVHVPFWLARGPAALFERMPPALLTRDQLRMLEGPDNVVTDGGASMRRLGLGDLVPLDEQLRRAVSNQAAGSASHS
jgi:NADH dehydrogenase